MKKETTVKIVQVLFAIYIVCLVVILFFYGNRVGNQFRFTVFSKEHFAMANFVPFKTISEFVTRMYNGTINTDIVVTNLLANLLMFMPMGMALPVLFSKRFNKLWKIVLFTAVLVAAVEFVQFVTFTGSADIDDLILNTIGATIGYGIINIKPLRNFLKLDEE